MGQSVNVDHVLMGARDLEAAGDRVLSEFGLASVAGGKHADWGTANRIVPLGRSYLEIVGVVDERQAANSFYGRHVLDRTAKGDRLIGWCLSADDIEQSASRLGIQVVPGSRTLPDGQVVRWRTAGAEEALASGYLPFFISWDIPPSLHPGRMHADHRVRPREIVSVSVGGDREELTKWLGGRMPPWAKAVDGPVGVHSVAIAITSGSGNRETITLSG